MRERGWTAGVTGAMLSGAASGGPGIVVLPSSEQAVARGLVYVMQNYPQVGGLQGFGCGFADLDADGDPDAILMGKANGLVGIFENDGHGFFTDRSLTSGIPALPEASGFAAADYNGDGLPDIYFTQTGLANVLMRNNGGFTFTNVTAAAGVGDLGAGTGPCWGDLNGDTRLDLFVPNYNGAVPGTSTINDKLYLNLGNGSFVDVSVPQGVANPGYGFQGVWFDYDQDGDVDLYLSNDRGHQPPLFEANRLWRNDNGLLVDVSGPSGAGVALFSMGVACGDFDGNGWADLYVTNLPGYAQGYNFLLLNLGTGTFLEASGPFGVGVFESCWGSIFYDFDNNSYMDLYVNSQFGPNPLFLTEGALPCQNFGPVANVVGNTGISYCSAVADVDDDGDLDLLVNNLGTVPPYPNPTPDLNVNLFINTTGQAKRWIKYRMVGVGQNLEAVGARIRTRTSSRWQLREIMAGGNGYLGQNELTVHVGLDAATHADEVQVFWPGGSPVRTLTGLPSNFTWTVYPPARLGDADGDGEVGHDDYLVLSGCYAGVFEPGCEVMDFDGDSDVDLGDAASFFAIYDGTVQDCDGNAQPDLLDVLADPGLDADGTGILDACESFGDLDGNGSVGITDFLQLLQAWGPCPDPPAACPADLDDSGSVGINDFLTLLQNWG
jgi:hypothetical protein